MQLLGNICVSLAGAIYLFPLQHLLLEYSRKKEDGGGAIAALIILAPMWLLLLVGLLLATSQGGFDVIPVRRGLVHGLVVAAVLALAVVTFVSFTCLNRPSWGMRLTLGLPVYLIPPLTILLIAAVLNPGVAGRIPPGFVRGPWLFLAGLSLVGCVAYLGFGAIRRVHREVSSVAFSTTNNRDVERRQLATIATLDAQRDFLELLGYSDEFHSTTVRSLAHERLRAHPRFLDALRDALHERDPHNALEYVGGTELSADECTTLAPAVEHAMLTVNERIHAELRYTPKDRLKLIRRWGRLLYQQIARKFSATGTDFGPAIAGFDQAFIPDEP